MKKYPPFYFLAAASYFSALVSLFLLNLMTTVNIFWGSKLLMVTAILAIKNPVFATLTLPWWGTMICYWRGKVTPLGVAFLILGLIYYLGILIKILFQSFPHFITYFFITTWAVGALGALIFPLVLQSYVQGLITEKRAKSFLFIINVLSMTTIISLIYSVRVVS